MDRIRRVVVVVARVPGAMLAGLAAGLACMVLVVVISGLGAYLIGRVQIPGVIEAWAENGVGLPVYITPNPMGMVLVVVMIGTVVATAGVLKASLRPAS